jgi:hypothetical protein
MQVAHMHILALILEILFFAGLAGSMLVAVIAFVGDCHDFFEKDRPDASQSIGD